MNYVDPYLTSEGSDFGGEIERMHLPKFDKLYSNLKRKALRGNQPPLQTASLLLEAYRHWREHRHLPQIGSLHEELKKGLSRSLPSLQAETPQGRVYADCHRIPLFIVRINGQIRIVNPRDRELPIVGNLFPNDAAADYLNGYKYIFPTSPSLDNPIAKVASIYLCMAYGVLREVELRFLLSKGNSIPLDDWISDWRTAFKETDTDWQSQ